MFDFIFINNHAITINNVICVEYKKEGRGNFVSVILVIFVLYYCVFLLLFKYWSN